MVVVVFRSRLREGIDMPALETMGARMHELVTQMPGFIAYKDFASADGENLTLVEFEDEASLLAWRNQPEHAAGQERARREFFTEYSITVCQPKRAYRFDLSRGREDLPV